FCALGVILGTSPERWLRHRLERRPPPPMERILEGADADTVLAATLESCLGLAPSAVRIARLRVIAEALGSMSCPPVEEARALLDDEFRDEWMPASCDDWRALGTAIVDLSVDDAPVLAETVRYAARYPREITEVCDALEC